ncbi:hypothetical protein U0C82_13170 [Fulvimarina sp. 2208YS6-2-32]|uniref:Lipoprotein n=1 Tax=Fulvimarina uroteuthidis TaxID=3098149 RepID=A0ABU5I413_9HYPH|nr:hypothetical protein [Fulvimarina sp. 2208YS6-2-32]MDY8110092.1 hypothetical protein [Fulvimarina sp. 2208YS6-2-32]
MAGPIPPASIGGGGGTYGSPSIGEPLPDNALAGGYGGLTAPTPPYPVSKLPDGYEPPEQTYAAASEPYLESASAAPASAGTIQSGPLLAQPSAPAMAQPSNDVSAKPMPDPVTDDDERGGGALEAPGDSRIEALEPEPSLAAPAAPAQQAPTRTAALSQSASEIQFLPLVGAPAEQATVLAEALSEAAAQSQVTIRSAADGRAAARLKGYFSAFDDGDQSVLVYVWDVLDPNDERIHRIQGQERFAKSPAGPWAGVDRAVLERVARTTLDEARNLPPASG